MGVNTILTHSGRGDQSVEVRSVNPVVMRASTILFKDYDTWQKYRKLRATDRVLSYGARGTTTNFELEKLICELEGGYRAQLFPTGLAALAMVLLQLCRSRCSLHRLRRHLRSGPHGLQPLPQQGQG